VSRIEQSGRMSLRRPKPLIKGGSVPEEEEELGGKEEGGNLRYLQLKPVHCNPVAVWMAQL